MNRCNWCAFARRCTLPTMCKAYLRGEAKPMGLAVVQEEALRVLAQKGDQDAVHELAQRWGVIRQVLPIIGNPPFGERLEKEG